jgi:hypothetical protein
MDVAPLLQPGVPGEAHAGEIGEFLAAQARCAAAATVGEAAARRRDAGAAALENVAQLSAGGSVSTRITRHLVTG